MKKGFTLIELLVVVLIIGILAAIALPNYQQAVAKTRFANLKPLVVAFKQAEELHYLANGEYAFNFEDMGFEVPGLNPSEPAACPNHVSDSANYDGMCYKLTDGKMTLSTRGLGAVAGQAVMGQLRDNKHTGADYIIVLDNKSAETGRPAGTRTCEAVCRETEGQEARCVWYRMCANETGSNLLGCGPDGEGDGRRCRFQYK